ncbi:MAG: UDP-N-acetylmuramoyl-tripeptide--D-alanyl-D-alanine ligase [Anaerolineae bacterium]|nr:UDP-N-acetylmuramoyl-tripeptide--D-alanyl-D-alanine ligase [Anaerolineae bacterium]
MTNHLTLGKVIRALGGQARLHAGLGARVSAVVVDSRQAIPGSLFVALRGEQQDGHAYVEDAFARGAIAAIVERDPGCGLAVDLRDPSAATEIELPEFPVCLLVPDALGALQRLAGWWRTQFELVVVGITGSVGKTTTKEFVASVLSQRYRVLKSVGNLNNEVGLPLTLLELEDDHEYAVLEMGTYGPGEITLLAEIAQPHIGVVTNVGPVHLERMGTIERIAQAKSELPRALPADGVAILNADDEWVRAMAEVTPARVFTYGLSPGCDLWADQVVSHGLEGVRFWFHHARPGAAEQAIHAHIALLGRHSVHTALRAAAVGLVAGLSWDEILRGLRTGEQLRLFVVPGVNGSTLLDDTYNSSPDSAIAALNLLEELQGRKIAVLGDMLELGVYEVEGHNRVGRRAMDVAALLITVGERGRMIGQAALDYGMPPERVIHFAANDQAIACLQALIEPGDVVLVKGSRGMAMEAVVEALARPPANGYAKNELGES